MTYILNKYIAKDNNYEPAIKDSSILSKESLEDYIINQLSYYYNKSVTELKEAFHIKYSISNKAFTYYLAKAMLNVSNERIEEFEKANIKIKAIRLQANGMPKESMSFPSFKYTEIIKQNWEDSELYNIFTETKYLFMIYQYTHENTLIFKKAMFWNVPMKDIDTEIKRVWKETIKRIKANRYNDLPHATESPILHVRPHARNALDTYPTPDGKSAVKKCFWFNREYIKKQIEEN